MIYLGENEVGYDPTGLGFPSIRGCHAIVYVTANGLFGLHNFGGSDSGSWKDRSDVFATFVNGHHGGPGSGKLMYGVCFATGGDSRGFGTDAQSVKTNWTGELAAFAKAVNFKGPIWGYDLTQKAFSPPAYVEYNLVTSTATCVIQTRAWQKDEGIKGANAAPLDHKLFRRNTNGVGYMLQNTASLVVTNVSQAGLGTVYPEQLR